MEFDEPYLLLQNRDGLFSKMVDNTSDHLATNLYEVARQAYFSRHELSDDCDLDTIPRTLDELMDLQHPQQEPDDEDSGSVSPRVRRSSSLEKEKLLFVTTV